MNIFLHLFFSVSLHTVLSIYHRYIYACIFRTLSVNIKLCCWLFWKSVTDIMTFHLLKVSCISYEWGHFLYNRNKSQLKINNHFKMESNVLSLILKLETFAFGPHTDSAFQNWILVLVSYRFLGFDRCAKVLQFTEQGCICWFLGDKELFGPQRWVASRTDHVHPPAGAGEVLFWGHRGRGSSVHTALHWVISPSL